MNKLVRLGKTSGTGGTCPEEQAHFFPFGQYLCPVGLLQLWYTRGQEELCWIFLHGLLLISRHGSPGTPSSLFISLRKRPSIRRIRCAPPYQGRAEIYAYWQRATASQENIEILWGTPVIAGNRVAIEWWATMREAEEGEITLPGCLVLRFAGNGLCEELREYWHVEVGSRALPRTGWGS